MSNLELEETMANGISHHHKWLLSYIDEGRIKYLT